MSTNFLVYAADHADPQHMIYSIVALHGSSESAMLNVIGWVLEEHGESNIWFHPITSDSKLTLTEALVELAYYKSVVVEYELDECHVVMPMEVK